MTGDGSPIPDLSGQTALVTGATRGIGQAIALHLAERGAYVFGTGRSSGSCAPLQKALDASAGGGQAVVLEQGNQDSLEKLVKTVEEMSRGLNILVNNASMLGPRVRLDDYPSDVFEEVLRVNVWGVFALTRGMLPLLRAQPGSRIINLSSGAGRTGKAMWGAYAASKFALEGLNQVMAAELGAEGIVVTAVNPGGTRTDMRAAAYPAEDPMSLPAPEDILPLFGLLCGTAQLQMHGRSLDARDWLKD